MTTTKWMLQTIAEGLVGQTIAETFPRGSIASQDNITMAVLFALVDEAVEAGLFTEEELTADGRLYDDVWNAASTATNDHLHNAVGDDGQPRYTPTDEEASHAVH